jgi:hypothetical protein
LVNSALTAEVALLRHGKYELTENNCQDYARVLLDEFTLERSDRPRVFHADDRRLHKGAMDYNTKGLRAAYKDGNHKSAECSWEQYPDARQACTDNILPFNCLG